jgi:5-epi-alpha-selinene synthase
MTVPFPHSDAVSPAHLLQPRIRELANIDFSRLLCPFLTARHEHAVSMHTRTMRWLEEMGLGLQQPPFEHVPDVAWLAAYAYPLASPDGLQIAADASTLFFVIDSLVDATTSLEVIRERNQGILGAISGASSAREDNAVHRALRHVGRRAQELGGAEWMACFLDQIRVWLDAQMWEMKNRHARRAPRLDDYLTMRPFSSGAYVQLLLSELTDSYRLSRAELDDESVRRLAQMASNQIAWTYDIVSFEENPWRGEAHNLVPCLMQGFTLPLEAAIDCAIEMHNHEVESFLLLERDLDAQTTLSPGVRSFVRALKNWMGGNLRWCRSRIRRDGARGAALADAE